MLALVQDEGADPLDTDDRDRCIFGSDNDGINSACNGGFDEECRSPPKILEGVEGKHSSSLDPL